MKYKHCTDVQIETFNLALYKMKEHLQKKKLLYYFIIFVM